MDGSPVLLIARNSWGEAPPILRQANGASSGNWGWDQTPSKQGAPARSPFDACKKRLGRPLSVQTSINCARLLIISATSNPFERKRGNCKATCVCVQFVSGMVGKVSARHQVPICRLLGSAKCLVSRSCGGRSGFSVPGCGFGGSAKRSSGADPNIQPIRR